jgi:isopenicillin-N N-acyltransferase like protein
LEFDRIFAYQCNEEILLGMLSSKSQDVSFGEKCSSLGCSKTNDTPSFIGQNLDWMNYYEGFNVLLNIKDEESGLESFINTQPGLLIMNGMNNAPIGVCVNSLEEYLNCSNDGLPLVYILRLILEKNSLEEAVHLLHTLPHASAQNFVLGGISDVVDYECSANKVEKFTPPSSNGRVYHTNHPLANQDYRMLPHSFKNAGTTAERFKFMNYRMSGSKPFSIESAKLLLRSPFGPINRINDGTNSGGMTTFSTIFELSDNPVLHITVGPPSISEYQKFSLSKQIMNN